MLGSLLSGPLWDWGLLRLKVCVSEKTHYPKRFQGAADHLVELDGQGNTKLIALALPCVINHLPPTQEFCVFCWNLPVCMAGCLVSWQEKKNSQNLHTLDHNLSMPHFLSRKVKRRSLPPWEWVSAPAEHETSSHRGRTGDSITGTTTPPPGLVIPHH